MKTRSRARIARLVPLLALSLAAGCGDLTGGGGDVVTGLTIEDGSGATLVTVSSSNSVSGTLTVARNQQRTLRIVLRNASGGVVQPLLGQSIRVSVTNPQVATWTDSGVGMGVLRGVGSGSTSMRIDLMEAGSVEYASPSINIQVS